MLGIDAAEIERLVEDIREAADEADAIDVLAAYAWGVPGAELAAMDLFQEAVSMGSVRALPHLAEALHWMGAYERTIPVLRAALDAHSGDQILMQGLLGEALWRTGDRGPDVVHLLSIGAEQLDRFGIDYAQALKHLGEFDEARTVLNRLVTAGEYGAAIVLGNLLKDEFDDEIGAEAAYRQGTEEGDAHSAYNLALMLRRQGRREESSLFLDHARRMGDMSEWPYQDDERGVSIP